MRFVPLLSAVFAAISATSFHAAAAEDFGKAEPFKAGDTVCFVGDSITHGGTYHSIITLYYATRFPDRKIAAWNCGIGGDRASGITSDERYRLNVDILGHKPTVATIMLGMNDIGHTDYYAPGKDAPDVEKKRARSLEVYDEAMQKLVGSLQKSGARLILITPSPYDETTKLPTARPEVAAGANGALGKCAEHVQAWAKQYGAGIVNFHEVMDAIDAREQAKDPAFTIVGPDRVHPGAVGHFVMAYTFLKAQGVPREVATVAIDAKKGKAGAARNCTIGDVKAGPTNVNFDCTEKALPMVVPDEAKAALALVPFEKELNEEKLVVTGLESGNYELKIDHESVGEYSAVDLAAGVNLAENAKTPQYVQSAAVTKLSKDRFGVGSRLRTIAAQLYPLSKSKVDVSDATAVEAAMNKRLATAKPPEDARIKAGLEAFQQREKLASDYEALGAAIHDAAQPTSHHFALVKK
ncbi:MAG: SGNH/GDSL hydrolase family protein [Chthoniobacteraceae bacterium]